MRMLHAGPYDFPGLHGFESRCQLWIAATDLHSFVLVRELVDNPGTSVTNAAEILRARVCREFSLAPDRVRWFEWYDHHEDAGLQFTEYLPTEASWRPSHGGDRKILQAMIAAQ